MKLLLIGGICVAVLSEGISEVLQIKRLTRILTELIKFIKLYESQLNYRLPDFSEFCTLAQSQGYRYILFDGNGICLENGVLCSVKKEFTDFLNSMGTTDKAGQIMLCHDYLSVFSEMLSEQKSKEKAGVQINLAISFLCAVGIVVAFI